MTHPSIIQNLDQEKNTTEKWVHRWGCSVSEAALDAKCNVFRLPHIEGMIGYFLESGCAISYGDPICAQENMSELANAFHVHCQEMNLNMIYIVATEQFADWAIKNCCSVMIEVGREIIFDPSHDPTEGSRGHKLRHKVNHVIHLGLKFQEYLSHDIHLEKAIQDLANAWVQKRKGPQIYLGDPIFFDRRADKRWFYVKNGDQIIGAALLSKMEKRQGWLLKFLLTNHDAPKGTSEFLVTSILETLRREKCPFLTYGMMPAGRVGKIAGLNKFSTWLARCAFNISKWIFNLDQRKSYWDKFHPRTEPTYLLFSQPQLGWKEIKAVMKTLKIELKL